ncbi:restriction endonuclease subunit S [Prevotellamassilia timonensis]|uniref:restriction endonuclease subunit S n=1 Tax=Prevotellamassilia timonensis TaxID=1852370 RepID=UPI001F35A1BE|nr:restriction endonuclease subunit S [Prevotellamassilia timonensis]MCF2635133.1 restriction endonuclease subunit S [Prevotellamassilia timonensis]
MRKTINIGDLGTIITGKTPPTTNKSYYGDYAVFIKPTDISEQSKYTYETEEMYSKLAAEKYESSLIPKGAICVPCIGTIGTKMTMAPCDCYTNQSINSIICNENYDNEYVYYLIKNFLPGLKAYNLGTASGREYVSKSNFEKIELVAEQDKDIQKRIGVILSRYDSLIENYQKQIKLLEEAAQRLYKEWFVDLHFPGHESTNIVDGVPEGWEIVTINDVTSKITTGLNPRKNFVLGNGNNYYVTIKNMANNTIYLDDKCDKIDDEAIEKINKRSDLKTGDILFSGIGTIGRVCLIDIPTNNWNVSESVFTLRANDMVSKEFMYLLLLGTDVQNYCQAHAHGAAQKGIRMADLKAFKFSLAPREVMQDFTRIVNPYINIVSRIQSQLRLLTEARDRLLPKLMSGEITV